MCVDKENSLGKKNVVLSPALISIGRLNPISAGLISRIELIGLIGRPARENLHCFAATCPLIK